MNNQLAVCINIVHEQLNHSLWTVLILVLV